MKCLMLILFAINSQALYNIHVQKKNHLLFHLSNASLSFPASETARQCPVLSPSSL